MMDAPASVSRAQPEDRASGETAPKRAMMRTDWRGIHPYFTAIVDRNQRVWTRSRELHRNKRCLRKRETGKHKSQHRNDRRFVRILHSNTSSGERRYSRDSGGKRGIRYSYNSKYRAKFCGQVVIEYSMLTARFIRSYITPNALTPTSSCQCSKTVPP